MKRNRIKFVIAIVFLIISLIFAIFYKDDISIFKNYILPVIYIYFIYDSMTVLIPIPKAYLPSIKHFKKNYTETKDYDKNKLVLIKRDNNIRALITFILYFGALSILGVIYLKFDFIEDIYIYIIFLLLNLGDYVCILFWCPFRSIILKNNCCFTCRITNWDRLMKFYILIFIPNIYTLTLVSLGILIFIIWEYTHQIHPERFYSISNDTLCCKSCNETLCNKKKE